MSNFGKSSLNNFSIVEVLVLILVIILVVFIAIPKASKFLKNVKMNNAINEAYAYKDGVNKYYVSRLMYDTNFKLDGKYSIIDGNLESDSDVYNLSIGGNIPSEGYLNYNDNVLKEGCILIDGFYVIINDGNISITSDNCMFQENTEVALN